MRAVVTVPASLVTVVLLVASLAACGGGEADKQSATKPQPVAPPTAKPASSAAPTPDSLPQALVLSLARFAPRAAGEKGLPQPLPAAMEFLVRRDGEWRMTRIEDTDSNVFHKAMAYETKAGEVRLLSAGGSAAILKLWRPGPGGLRPNVLWQKDFGGKFSRMRDVEVADLYADGRPALAVATHDQGVVAILRPDPDKNEVFSVEEIDHEPDTFVHEIEIGDVDGDAVLEVYATPSEPNRLDGSVQTGHVVRYVPARGEGRTIVADLGERHAKEILVEDVDGNGRDELYVIVEGVIEAGSKRLVEPVEIRRYEADTKPDEGVVIATMDDRLGRFLTAGDLDGDGKRELVAALFSSGLWLLRPGSDPMQPWQKESIDTHSGGFEHACVIADLDSDGVGELYVASDNDLEVRRYVWKDGKPLRDVIYSRAEGGSVFTWNIMPIPVALVP